MDRLGGAAAARAGLFGGRAERLPADARGEGRAERGRACCATPSRRAASELPTCRRRARPEAERAALTREAMASGADVIYQAPCGAAGPGRLYGIADFLVRVEGDGGAGSGGSGGGGGLGAEWHYTAWESKLSRARRRRSSCSSSAATPRCCAEAQGVAPRVVSLVLGGGGGPDARSSCAWRRGAAGAPRPRAVRRIPCLLRPVGDARAPRARHAAGRWTELAAAQFKERDDLRLVARLSKKQAARRASPASARDGARRARRKRQGGEAAERARRRARGAVAAPPAGGAAVEIVRGARRGAAV